MSLDVAARKGFLEAYTNIDIVLHSSFHSLTFLGLQEPTPKFCCNFSSIKFYLSIFLVTWSCLIKPFFSHLEKSFSWIFERKRENENFNFFALFAKYFFIFCLDKQNALPSIQIFLQEVKIFENHNAFPVLWKFPRLGEFWFLNKYFSKVTF